jgi:hypothetical protein
VGSVKDSAVTGGMVSRKRHGVAHESFGFIHGTILNDFRLSGTEIKNCNEVNVLTRNLLLRKSIKMRRIINQNGYPNSLVATPLRQQIE